MKAFRLSKIWIFLDCFSVECCSKVKTRSFERKRKINFYVKVIIYDRMIEGKSQRQEQRARPHTESRGIAPMLPAIRNEHKLYDSYVEKILTIDSVADVHNNNNLTAFDANDIDRTAPYRSFFFCFLDTEIDIKIYQSPADPATCSINGLSTLLEHFSSPTSLLINIDYEYLACLIVRSTVVRCRIILLAIIIIWIFVDFSMEKFQILLFSFEFWWDLLSIFLY